jgi:hypothetical protein
MGTRSFTFTAEETRLLMRWASRADHEADSTRMLTRPNSPQEAAAEADQLLVQQIQDKLTARESHD